MTSGVVLLGAEAAKAQPSGAGQIPRLIGQDAATAPIQAKTPLVSLAGILGRKALLVVQGAEPKLLAVGEVHHGVTLLEVTNNFVVIMHNGQRLQVHTGDTPFSTQPNSVSGTGNGNTIVLAASTGGHYRTSGQINGRYVDFLVDTGATTVSMGMDVATTLGLDYKSGQPIRAQTANGMVTGYLVQLDSVRVGSVTVHQVEAFVSPATMRHVLLGNSFLSRFDMQQSSGQLVLQRRY